MLESKRAYELLILDICIPILMIPHSVSSFSPRSARDSRYLLIPARQIVDRIPDPSVHHQSEDSHVRDGAGY